jgi:hypothetical protein
VFGLGPERTRHRADAMVAALNEWADGAHEYGEPVLGGLTWLDNAAIGLADVLRRT